MWPFRKHTEKRPRWWDYRTWLAKFDLLDRLAGLRKREALSPEHLDELANAFSPEAALPDRDAVEGSSPVRSSATWKVTRPIWMVTSRFLHKWDELQGRLAKIEPEALMHLDVRDAQHEADRLRRQFLWHLRQGWLTLVESKLQVELFLVLAVLDVQAEHPTRALLMAQKVPRWIKGRAKELKPAVRYRTFKRLTRLYLVLAQGFLKQNQPARALTCIKDAVSMHTLDAGHWQTLIGLLEQCEAPDGKAFDMYIDYLSCCSPGQPDAITARVSDRLRQIVQVPDAARPDDRDEAIHRLHRIHQTADWLDWPLLRMAEEDLQSEHLGRARTKLEHVYDRAQNATRAHTAFLLGQVAFYEEKYGEADAHFDDALEGGVDLAGVYEFMGVAKAHVGEYEVALERIEQALEVAPGDLYLLTQKANILLSMNRLEEAQEQFEALLTADPDCIEAHFGLAKILELEQAFEEAAARYRQVLERDPVHVPALFSLALVLLKKKKVAEATTALQRVHQHDARHLPTRAELGILMIKKGIETHAARLDVGIEHLRACEQARYPDKRVAYWLGRALVETGAYEEGLSCWEPLLKKNPKSKRLADQIEWARFLQAVALGKEGQQEAAVEALAALPDTAYRQLPVAPALVHFGINLARKALVEGRHERARQLIGEVLEHEPGHTKALLVEAMSRLVCRELSREELAALTQAMNEGSEKEICKLLLWFHGRTVLAEADPEDGLWHGIARAQIPDLLSDDPALALINFLQESTVPAASPDEDVPEQLLALTSRLGSRPLFAVDDLGWRIARAMEESGAPRTRWMQSLREALEERDSPPLRFALGILALQERTLNDDALFVQQTVTRENERLVEYLTTIFGYAAAQEIKNIHKEPARISQAHHWLTQAIDLTGSVL